MRGMNDWEYGMPPNEEIVEVEHEGKIIRVMAFYGRDGTRSHWTTPFGEGPQIQWEFSAFSRWRRPNEWVTNI